MIPLEAIDPDRVSREWHDSFTTHLDVVPPLIEVIVWMTLPSIKASRTDQVRVSGGGYIDNLPDILPGTMAGEDARELWSWLVAYTRAVAEWITPDRPAPTLDEMPNPDPLSARHLALLTIGWLIDHATHVHGIPELDEHTDAMFVIIRSLRGRYGVFAKPRRPLERCDLCGERKVAFTWASNPNGSAKPIRVGRCRNCGETYDVAPVVQLLPVAVLSEACADGAHQECRSVHCECGHHERKAER